MTMDHLIVRNARGKCLARPGLSLTLYFNETLHTLAPKVVEHLRAYLELVGPGTLRACFDDEGRAQRLSPAQLDGDRARLAYVSDATKAIILEYSSDAEGWVGDFGFSFHGADFSHDLYEGERANYLRMDFPHSFLELQGVDSFMSSMSTFIELAPVQFANAGFTFQRSSATQGDSTPAINRLLFRYLGFDPGYKDVMDDMRNRAFTAHWTNYLGRELVESLGGARQVVNTLRGAEVRAVAGGVLIRACKYPPVGDVEDGAADVGRVPDVARLLEPVRADITALGEPIAKLNGAAWMQRFDELPCSAWDNEEVYERLWA